MKRGMIAFAIWCLPILVEAGDETRRQAVARLMELTNAAAMIDTTGAQVEAMLQNMKQQLGVRPDEEEIFSRYSAKVAQLMNTEFTWEKLEGPMIDLYLRHYTDREVEDMIAFYETDSGRSTVAKMPAVMQDSMQLGMGAVQSLMPSIQALSKELQQELKAARQ